MARLRLPALPDRAPTRAADPALRPTRVPRRVAARLPGRPRRTEPEPLLVYDRPKRNPARLRLTHSPTAQARYVKVRGAKVRVVVDGPDDGIPVVLVHGLGRSLEDWSDQIVRLGDRYRVIALDLPGFGLSKRTGDKLTVEALAAAVLKLLDKLGERRPAVIMGNSLGGAVAMTVAATRPERVAGLVLVDSAGFGTEVSIGLRLLDLGIARHALRLRRYQRVTRLTERNMFHDKSFVTPERVAYATKVGRRKHFVRTFEEVAREIGSAKGVDEAWRTALVARVAALDLPTLVVWGAQDWILPATHARTAGEAFPQAKVVVLDQCGHAPQIEQADAFAALARDFLDALPPPVAD